MDKPIEKGQITETLPDGKYRVMLESGIEILCYLAGKMKFNHVKVLVGDWVSVELDPYKGKTTNRIIRRL